MKNKAIKRRFMSGIGFMKWGRLNELAIQAVTIPGDLWKEIWISPDVESLWIAFDDGYGTGYNMIDYYDMEKFKTPAETIRDSISESYDYNEGETGNIKLLIEGYGYEDGDEKEITAEDLESWEALGGKNG